MRAAILSNVSSHFPHLFSKNVFKDIESSNLPLYRLKSTFVI